MLCRFIMREMRSALDNDAHFQNGVVETPSAKDVEEEMINKNRMPSQRRGSRVHLGIQVIACVLAIAALCIVISFLKRASTVSTASFLYEPDRYGAVYFYAHTPTWEAGDQAAMETALQEVQAMGFDTVIQTFAANLIGTGEEDRWLIFLDAAQAVGVDVVAYLWPNTVYHPGDLEDPDDTEYDTVALKLFLDVVGAHPALLGYIGFHEPLEPRAGLSQEEMQNFYTEMKTYAPNLDVTHYMGDVAYWDEHRPDWSFGDGMCDICMVWYYPFRYDNSNGCPVDNPGDPIYQADIVPPVVQSNVAMVNVRDPDAEVWFLGQTFGRTDRCYRMPTAEEMESLYLMAMAEPLDGFLWYSWSHTEGMADVSLGDEEMEDQQEEAGDIPDTHTGYAGLEIETSVFPVESWYLGGTITYTLTFTNNGPQPADSIVITDLVPGEIVNPMVVDSSGAAIALTAGTSFVWTVDPLDVGEGGTIILTGIVDPDLERGSVIRNTAEITAPLARSSAALSSTAVLTVSEQLDSLRISKAIVPDGADWYAGDTITYMLTFTNDGPHVATNVVITDLMPAELTNPTVVGSDGAASVLEPGTTFVWTVSSLDVGEHGIITLTAVIDSDLAPMSIVENSAQIMAPIADPGGNLSAIATISISSPFPIASDGTLYLPLIMANKK